MNSPFAWPGGKRNLKKTLLASIPEHDIYVEVFCGSAKLLFAKERSRCEILNDRNGDITNFFRVVKHRAAELAELFDHEMVHAERFRELRQAEPPADELQRAMRFAYLVWYSYGAKGQHFAGATLKEAGKGEVRRSLAGVRAALEATALRLQGVLIEQRDFAEVLVRYDSPRTWFYLDPPYYAFGNIAQYESLSAEQHEQLFAALAGLQANWLMSFDDCPEVRAMSKQQGFRVRKVEVAYTLAHTSGSRGPRGELLITPD